MAHISWIEYGVEFISCQKKYNMVYEIVITYIILMTWLLIYSQNNKLVLGKEIRRPEFLFKYYLST